jgi:hypothetical protein
MVSFVRPLPSCRARFLPADPRVFTRAGCVRFLHCRQGPPSEDHREHYLSPAQRIRTLSLRYWARSTRRTQEQRRVQMEQLAMSSQSCAMHQLEDYERPLPVKPN